LSDVESILIIASVQIAVADNSSVKVIFRQKEIKINKIENMELCGRSGNCMDFSV
jgi:hypothetical protein